MNSAEIVNPHGELLPDCRGKKVVTPHGMVFTGDATWVPIYCGNCGVQGGKVPLDSCNFAFWLCDKCAEKWLPTTGTMTTPDDVFWHKVSEAQQELYGRQLSAPEMIEVLKDEGHTLTKLSKDRKK